MKDKQIYTRSEVTCPQGGSTQNSSQGWWSKQTVKFSDPGNCQPNPTCAGESNSGITRIPRNNIGHQMVLHYCKK